MRVCQTQIYYPGFSNRIPGRTFGYICILCLLESLYSSMAESSILIRRVTSSIYSTYYARKLKNTDPRHARVSPELSVFKTTVASNRVMGAKERRKERWEGETEVNKKKKKWGGKSARITVGTNSLLVRSPVRRSREIVGLKVGLISCQWTKEERKNDVEIGVKRNNWEPSQQLCRVQKKRNCKGKKINMVKTIIPHNQARYASSGRQRKYSKR